MIQNLDKYLTKPLANLVLINAPIECYALTDYILQNLFSLINPNCSYKYTADRFFKYSEINDILSNGSLFNDTTYIEISYKSKPPAEQQKELLNLIDKVDPSTFLIIITDRLNKTDSNAAWVKQFNQQGWVINLTANNAVEIMKHKLQHHSLSINSNALNMLQQQNQDNLSQLMQEINQLTLLYPSGHEISLDDIKQHSIDNSLYNIYQLNNAYLSGNLDQSMLILDNIYQKPEDAILLLWLINEDVKKIIRLKAKLKQGISFNQIAQDLKIWGNMGHLYQNIERRISYTLLLTILDDLANLDMMIKGVSNSDIKQQLIHIIHNLCSKEKA